MIISIAIIIIVTASVIACVVRKRRLRRLQLANANATVPAVYRNQNVYLGSYPTDASHNPNSNMTTSTYNPAPSYPATGQMETQPPPYYAANTGKSTDFSIA